MCLKFFECKRIERKIEVSLTLPGRILYLAVCLARQGFHQCQIAKGVWSAQTKVYKEYLQVN